VRKLIFSVLIVLICIPFGTVSAVAAPITSVTFNVDGRNITFDESTGYPFINDQGFAMMPLKASLSSIGCSVAWDEYSRSVITSKGLTEVVIPVGKSEIVVNQKTIPINTAAVIRDGRTFLPLRAVFEAYKYQVSWDAATKTVSAAPVYTPYNINGGTTGVFLRKQLPYTGFDGIQAEVVLPTVKLGQKGDCPYVYFGFDFPGDKGNVEGGFQFIEDEKHPGYNKWTVFMRQGDEWRWGDNILLDQGTLCNLKFYADKVSDTRTDLVLELDGKEVIRKTSAVNNFNEASAKYVDAIAMSVPFDGTNCPTASVAGGCYNLAVSEYNKNDYTDIGKYDLYSEYKNGFWYGTVECPPDYMHYRSSENVSLYRTSKTGGSITLSADEITSGVVSYSYSAGGELSHGLSPAELKEFIVLFNSCDIREGEREWTTVHDHDHLSDSIDLMLQLKNGDVMYISAYYDGDIPITYGSGSYFYLHNSKLLDYMLNTMGKYLFPGE
jgi:Copper amine oxidase N-terminal domain.